MADWNRLSRNPIAVFELFDDAERNSFISWAREKASDADSSDAEIVSGFDASYLLRWIVRQRTPFIKMASEIGALLKTLEVSIAGKIEFLVLPEGDDQLELAFGPQLRKLVETALSWSDTDVDITEAQLRELEASISGFCGSCSPRFVKRDSALGLTLRQLGRGTGNPFQARIYETQANSLARSVREFSPVDVQRLREVDGKLQTLVEKAGQSRSALPIGLHETLSRIQQQIAGTLRHASACQSSGYPAVGPSLSEPMVYKVLGEIDVVERALQRASNLDQDKGTLFHAMALSFWKQRWRIYELWLFCHVCRLLCRNSDNFDASHRIAEGRWRLKFSRDSEPVLTCIIAGERLDVYYQYFEQGDTRANMPDVAVKLHSTGAWLLVLDPKSGSAFTCRQLEEVCFRYADAFQAQLTCVANYFPDAFKATILPHQSAALIYQGFRPDSVHVLDNEMRLAMKLAGVDIRHKSVVVVFDLSGSIEPAHMYLDQAVRTALMSESGIDLEDATLIFFNDRPLEVVSAASYLGAPLARRPAGGTDSRASLTAAMERLSKLSGRRELWLVGDRDSFQFSCSMRQQLVDEGLIVRAFIASATAQKDIAELCHETGGSYEKAGV